MRIVIANPNTTQAVTDLLVREARQAVPGDVEVAGFTARAGVAAIDTPAGAEAAAEGVVARLADAGRPDVGIVGGFVDPGLDAARASVAFPVVGMGEASMLAACLLTRRFVVVTVGRSTATLIESLIERYGLGARAAAVQAVEGRLIDVIGQQAHFDEACSVASREALGATGAGAVVLGGAMFTGMASRIASRVPVPVIDPIRAATLQAWMLARLGRAPAT